MSALRALVALAATAAVLAGPAEGAAKRARPARTVASAPAATPARSLDDIHIEGEIPVPQVLFVSVREQRRFLDFDHARWRRSARALAASTTPPTVTLQNAAHVTPAQESAR